MDSNELQIALAVVAAVVTLGTLWLHGHYYSAVANVTAQNGTASKAGS